MWQWIVGGTALLGVGWLLSKKEESNRTSGNTGAAASGSATDSMLNAIPSATHSVGSAPMKPESLDDKQAGYLAAVKDGKAAISWGTIRSEIPGHTAEFRVTADALKLDGIRIAVNANTNQYIADALDCRLLTPKLADLLWSQRQTTLPPFPRGRVDDMSTVQAMLDHNKKIDAMLATLPQPYGIICTVGKLWVLDNDLLKRPGMAMNYGWHYGTAPSYQGVDGEVTASRLVENGKPVRLIQGRGTRHDGQHIDYSQVCMLVSNDCLLDGKPARLDTILTDPSLAELANVGGPLKVLRQPTAK